MNRIFQKSPYVLMLYFTDKLKHPRTLNNVKIILKTLLQKTLTRETVYMYVLIMLLIPEYGPRYRIEYYHRIIKY